MKIKNEDKVISKEQYQKMSAKANLPMRCPILNICGRRASTIYFNTYRKTDNYKTAKECMLADGEISSNFDDKSIRAGESIQVYEGDGYFYFKSVCPEVNLFDSGNSKFPEAGAITSGRFNYSEIQILEVDESKHFSECPEFSQYAFESKKSKTKSNQSARKGISSRLRFEIFQRDNFTCNYCGKTKEDDGIKLEIDHIMPVSEGGKDEFSNLITSCKDCNGGKSNKVI